MESFNNHPAFEYLKNVKKLMPKELQSIYNSNDKEQEQGYDR